MDLLYEKYPEGSFAHWLAMFDIHQKDWSDESIKDHAGMYNHIEGKEEYEELCREVEQILSNDDLELFVDYQKEHEFSIPQGSLADLQRMAKLMLSFDAGAE